MALAVVIVLLVIATVIFHFASPWWFTPLASNWGTVDNTVNITFWVTGTVFILVNFFLAYVVIKYRYRKDNQALYEPENKKLEGWLTGITAVGVAAMLAPGLFVWAKFVDVPDDAAEVEAVGQQWSWSFRYPGKDGVFGRVDPSLFSVDNLFGMSPDDPHGQDDILVEGNEVHLPVNKPVKFLLRSKDVLHNFAVAPFRAKMDLVPGMITYLWLTPTQTGSFDILCEELCGMAHFAMRGIVTVEAENEFQTWLAGQPTFAQVAASPKADAVTGQATFAVCAACHGVNGEGNQALNAPKTAGGEGWYLKRQLHSFKHGLRGVNEKDIYGMQMAPFAATLADDAAINNLVAYIEGLPNNPVQQTVTGDIERGRNLYANCGACHGMDGKGLWSQNAPRLAGVNDWYLIRQLQNFKQGVRGGQAGDGHGKQMVLMSVMLPSEQDMNDVVAYINTL